MNMSMPDLQNLVCFLSFTVLCKDGLSIQWMGASMSAHPLVISRANFSLQTHNLNHTYVRATLAVSYAAPTYYADRLCERGRCYLRQWYNPDMEMRKKWNNLKYRLEKGHGEKRKEQAAAKAASSNSQGAKKTAEEKHAAKEIRERDKATIAERLRRQLWDEMCVRFTRKPDEPEAERNKLFHRTMYWM
jgi:eukaryotic translation initiation factor 2C